MNKYFDMLVDRLAVALEECGEDECEPEAVLGGIVEDDNINGSRTFNREEAKKFFLDYMKNDGDEFRDWIEGLDLYETIAKAYMDDDYEKLDVLAELYTAEYESDRIIDAATKQMQN